MDLIPISKHRYATRLDVVGYSGDYPTLGTTELDQIRRLVYHGHVRTPVTLRVNNEYVFPEPQDSVPADTLAVPKERLESLGDSPDVSVVGPELAELCTGGF